MAYDEAPVYHDPPTNQWFGMQAWSMERVAEYYYVTGNAQAKASSTSGSAGSWQHTTLGADGTYEIPSTLAWSGKPDRPGTRRRTTRATNCNAGLHVKIRDYGQDVGVASATRAAR